MTARLKFGIAGWSYDDWRGVVYPRNCRDTLRFCAEYVDLIEINNTFYRFPVAAHCASWVRRVEGLSTEFSAKIPGDFTHRLVRDAGAAQQVVEGFAPLAESGRLLALLAQFSYRFEWSERNLDHLAWLRESFGSVAPLVVEVRHKSWASAEGLAELRELSVAVADLDYPGAESGFSAPPTGCHGPEGIAYFRLHGRNEKAWFDKDAGRDETYDYEYGSSEIEQLGERAGELGTHAASILVVANNHFEGKAMKTALELAARHLQAKVAVPQALLEHYPDLRRIAKRQQEGLFD